MIEPQIESLVKGVGLLNVPLRHNQQAGVPLYALLNGSSNNVCAGVNTERPIMDYRQMAWSSGCYYFLEFFRNRCDVIRFDTPKVESYEENFLLQNAEKFFAHIAQSKRNEENQVVPFILRIYRKLRNEIRSEQGIDSLRGLLYLLASTCDEEPIHDLDKWGLTKYDREIALSIGENRWDMISEELKSGLLINGNAIIPNLELTLRHTAGKLFEEANYIAYLPNQLTLFPDERIRYQYKTNEDGAYFTPSYVARSIVEEALLRFDINGKDCITLFDPACGAGGFLVEALRQLKATGYIGSVKVIAWDKAETAIAISQFVLKFEKREWGDKIELLVRHQDSLAPDVQWPNDVDILLMNPPFLSWDMMSQALRVRVSEITGGAGKMNLAAAFLIKACESINENGVLGTVLPNSILNDAAYKGVRSRMLDEMNLKLVGGLGSFVFKTVLAYTSMLVAMKQRNRIGGDTTILWTNNVVGAAEDALKALRKSHANTAIVDEPNYSIYKGVIDSGHESWKPEKAHFIVEKAKLERDLGNGLFSTIGKLFNIVQGVRTGANRVFIIDHSVYSSFSPEERAYFRPSVDNLAVQNGKLSVVNYVFYPYSTGLESITSEVDLAIKVPEYYSRILKPHQKQLVERLSITDKERWWELTRNRPWQAEHKPKMVSTEFGKSGSFAIDYQGDFVVERGFAWNLKGIDDSQFKKYSEAYLAILVMCKKLVASVDRFDKVVPLTEFLGEDNLPGKPLLVRFVNRSLDVISF